MSAPQTRSGFKPMNPVHHQWRDERDVLWGAAGQRRPPFPSAPFPPATFLPTHPELIHLQLLLLPLVSHSGDISQLYRSQPPTAPLFVSTIKPQLPPPPQPVSRLRPLRPPIRGHAGELGLAAGDINRGDLVHLSSSVA